ncbi:adenylate/guanylate cyclase domain-containing protein [Gordonia jinhuaensis]|uniref:Adenylate/guanylate cyclase domain-containing protein n=1 Tax=Gordonia jinhuaensis TaxID=1517702 RepID=A0A916T1X4_9ACTN|nr:adenylate/guanylate cyclase domain-containing protein [Gordonia jinhuaensis]GGB28286.1 adenylate/guanylate cyclase domain-containing protein [Gordonia jinhuaensis]
MHSDSSATDAGTADSGTPDPSTPDSTPVATSSVSDALTDLFGGAERTRTREDILTEYGISNDHADRVWSAFGLPHDPTGGPVLTDAEFDALALFVMADRDVPGEEADERALQYEIATARTIGQTMSRLAEWEAVRLAQIARDPRFADRIPELARGFEIAQTMVWRRHLVAGLQNAMQNDRHGASETVVGFVDIVGYTSLTRRIDTGALTDLLDAFESNAHSIVTDAGGQVVKNLGDGILFTIDNPTAAGNAGLALTQLADDQTMPPVRVGLAYGPVVTRFGDVFGESVNIAARLAGAARAGSVLIDSELADALADDDTFFIKTIPTLSVNGYRRLHARVLQPNRRHSDSRR